MLFRNLNHPWPSPLRLQLLILLDPCICRARELDRKPDVPPAVPQRQRPSATQLRRHVLATRPHPVPLLVGGIVALLMRTVLLRPREESCHQPAFARAREIIVV